MYKITFDPQDAGLSAPAYALPLGDNRNNTIIPPIIPDNTDIPVGDSSHYPTQACRSAVGNQPYDQFSSRVSFLQLGQSRAHGNVMEATQLLQMTKEEQMLFTTSSNSPEPLIDNTIHRVHKTLITTSENELKVWGYVMTQYILKPGLREFGNRGQKAAVRELMQLHVMDTWTPMHVDKLSQEQRIRALSSLLFLKEKRTGDIKGRACINGAPQRNYIPKEEAASPTMLMESKFITASNAAHE